MPDLDRVVIECEGGGGAGNSVGADEEGGREGAGRENIVTEGGMVRELGREE